jgi:hypothetical protein
MLTKLPLRSTVPHQAHRRGCNVACFQGADGLKTSLFGNINYPLVTPIKLSDIRRPRNPHLSTESPSPQLRCDARSVGLPTSATNSDNPPRCTLYIMRRTQLYLNDHLWNALHTRAQSQKTTISELVREAIRERYLGKQDEQRKAMQEFVGIRKDRPEPLEATAYLRILRRSDRMDRLRAK